MAHREESSMSTTHPNGRRAPGTGSISVRRDAAGRETFYGKWTAPGGRQVKRKIGLKRVPGSRDGLTRRQAEIALRELMAATDALPVTSVRVDMQTAATTYLAEMQTRGRKPSSIRSTRAAFDTWLVPHFDGRTLDSIQPADVEDLLRKMRIAGLAAKSIRNYGATLSAVFNFAMHARRRWVTTNPVAAVDLPTAPAYVDIRFLSVDEVHALAAAAHTGVYRELDAAMYRTAAMTGVRLGECISLRWRDVDFGAGRVRIRRTYDRKSGLFTTPKSRRSERSVPLADDLAGVLERLGKSQHGAGFDPDGLADALVFADPYSGGPVNDNHVRTRYRLALKAANLDPSRRFHDLRHTFGTTMAAAGVPMRTLQEWMGHRDIATTQRYADYAPSAHEREWIEQAFRSDRGTSRGTSVRESQRT